MCGKNAERFNVRPDGTYAYQRDLEDEYLIPV